MTGGMLAPSHDIHREDWVGSIREADSFPLRVGMTYTLDIQGTTSGLTFRWPMEAEVVVSAYFAVAIEGATEERDEEAVEVQVRLPALIETDGSSQGVSLRITPMVAGENILKIVVFASDTVGWKLYRKFEVSLSVS